MAQIRATGFVLLSVSLIFCCWLITGCNNSAYQEVSVYAGRNQAGQRFRTKVELYLFQSIDDKQPYIGRNDSRDYIGAKTLPNTIDVRYVGQEYRQDTILAIVLVGAELITQSIIREKSGFGVDVKYVCRLEYAGRTVARVSTFFIQSSLEGRDGQLPEINAEIAEHIP